MGLVNLSNHPYSEWGTAQRSAAEAFGEVIDIPFPNIDPKASTKEVVDLAYQYFRLIMEIYDISAVHLMGEAIFSFALTSMLLKSGIRVVASTTIRDVVINQDGSKTVKFKFNQFRDYKLI